MCMAPHPKSPEDVLPQNNTASHTDEEVPLSLQSL